MLWHPFLFDKYRILSEVEDFEMETITKENVVVENKMGVMPVNKLLLNMSVPMMLSMLVQALYNIVDSIFVSRICEDALTAVSLAFPLQMLIVALGGGLGIGVNALLSRSLGEKNQVNVNNAAMNGILCALMNAVIFFVLGLTIVKPFYISQTTDAEIVTYGIEYLTVICVCSIGVYMQFIFERLLQSTGNTFYAMITQTTGAVINIILDPILIFGLCGMPKMGVKGAAVATVIGQIIAAILAIIINLKKNVEIQFKLKGFRPSFAVIKQIYAVGIPSIIMQSIGSIMTYGMNQILIGFSSTATAVFGVYFKLQSFIFMPVFGLNNGMVPIIAYNFGAMKKERMMKTIKLSILYAVSIMTIGMAIFLAVPEKLFILFNASEQMLGMGIPALRIICFHFPIAGFCIVCGSVFQALGNGVYSMVVSICRQVVVLLPVAFLLSLMGNVNYVWLAFPIAEIASLTLNIIFFSKIKKNIIDKIGV